LLKQTEARLSLNHLRKSTDILKVTRTHAVGTETVRRIKAEMALVTNVLEWPFRPLIAYISNGGRSPTNTVHEVASVPNE
jgi:hypothetical protein